MANKPNDTGSDRLQIEVEALDVRKDEEAPVLIAYAFSQSGRLLARTELKEGKGDLPLPRLKEPETFRVLVGPAIEAEDSGEVLSALMRLNAAEISVRSNKLTDSLRIPIDRQLRLCWYRFCLVRGTLLKKVITGGLPVDLPVCGAEVEVYEVDPIPLIVAKIPDLYLERIRYLVRKPWPPPPPERFPGGIPFPPDPPIPFLEGSSNIRRAPIKAAARRDTAPAFAREELLAMMAELRGGESEREFKVADESLNAKDKQSERVFNFNSGEATEVDPEEAAASVRALSEAPEIKSAASISLDAFKSALLARPSLITSLICWIYPLAVNMQLVATATTDECGKFRTRFYRGCSSDTPDLYFKAFRRIGFLRIPIYAPLPIACHTWWNYACGSEVTLKTMSPFALTCPPCKPVIAPPHWVLAMAVGNTSLAAVRGTSTDLQPTTNSSNIGLTSGGAPFGGEIRLRFEFDNTLRTDLNVRFYQVRWRKLGSGNPYVALIDDVWRHHAHMVGTTLMIEPYKLGPQPVGPTPNLYEIPPALPPLGQWSFPDVVVDTTSAAFPSAALAPLGGGEGDYAFELTLYDSAGIPVNANALGITYVVPTTLDLTATIPTANASVLGLVTASGRLVYQLHVDNNRCDAGLQPPEISGAVSADPCGLLRYKPGNSVTLRWTAAHPHSFATFEHTLIKGATALPPPMTTSGVVTPPPGVHTDVHTVADLLGSCTIAGFAETVSVWAMATNGWSRQSQYDDHAIQAFALAPEGA